MKRIGILLMLAVLGSITAFALTPVTKQVGRWAFMSGLFIGNATETNRITRTVTADVDYNFPSSTIVCNDSWTATATGVKPGDPCFLGLGPRDGGVQSIVAINSTFMAFSDAVDTVKVRHCPAGTAIDPPDSGFVVRCISSQ